MYVRTVINIRFPGVLVCGARSKICQQMPQIEMRFEIWDLRFNLRFFSRCGMRCESIRILSAIMLSCSDFLGSFSSRGVAGCAYLRTSSWIHQHSASWILNLCDCNVLAKNHHWSIGDIFHYGNLFPWDYCPRPNTSVLGERRTSMPRIIIGYPWITVYSWWVAW